MHLSCKYLIAARHGKGYSYPEYRYTVCLHLSGYTRMPGTYITPNNIEKDLYSHVYSNLHPTESN